MYYPLVYRVFCLAFFVQWHLLPQKVKVFCASLVSLPMGQQQKSCSVSHAPPSILQLDGEMVIAQLSVDTTYQLANLLKVHPCISHRQRNTGRSAIWGYRKLLSFVEY